MHFQGRQICQICFCLPSENRSTLKRKEFGPRGQMCPLGKWVYAERKECAPTGSKFVSFSVDPFSEGALYTVYTGNQNKKTNNNKKQQQKKTKQKQKNHKKQQQKKKQHKSCLNCKNDVKSARVSSPLTFYWIAPVSWYSFGFLYVVDYSISSLRTFYICRDRRFVTIPANIKKNLITNWVINRLMSISFSFQSRNFIKPNKSKH